MEPQLTVWVRRVRRQASVAWAVRAAAVASAVVAVAVALGAHWACIALIPAAATLATRLRPTPAEAAVALDRAAGLHDEVACAWDHRESERPVDVAQRGLALGHLAQATPRRVVRRPSLLWVAFVLPWIWPLAQPRGGPHGGEPVSPVPAIGPHATKGGVPVAAPPSGPNAATGARAPSPKTERSARVNARPAEPTTDAGAASAQAGDRANRRALQGTAGGVGREAGRHSGGAAGREVRPLRAGRGEEIALKRVGGVMPARAARPGEPPASAAVRPPRDDELTDPARPYPARYHAVIAAWFGRTAP